MDQQGANFKDVLLKSSHVFAQHADPCFPTLVFKFKNKIFKKEKIVSKHNDKSSLATLADLTKQIEQCVALVKQFNRLVNLNVRLDNLLTPDVSDTYLYSRISVRADLTLTSPSGVDQIFFTLPKLFSFSVRFCDFLSN